MTVLATGSLGGYDDDDDDVLFFSGSDYVFIVFFFPVTFSIFFVSFCIFFCKCSKTKLIMTLNKNIFYNVYRFISFLSLGIFWHPKFILKKIQITAISTGFKTSYHKSISKATCLLPIRHNMCLIGLISVFL